MIMPYLHYKGNCEEAFNFYAKCFGIKDVHIVRLNNNPNNPVMHASVMLTENGGISGADTDKEVKISGMEILVLLPNREIACEITTKLSEGGTLVSEFAPHPPPDDFSGCSIVLDKYGYTWFLNA